MKHALDKFKINSILLTITVLLTACSGIYYWLHWSYPIFIASSYKRCYTFFNLENMPYLLVDQLNSQGEDVFAFGEKIYYLGGLKEEQLNSLRAEMIEKGGVETNDNVSFIKKRHKIVGEFKLYKDKSPYQVIVSYKEIK